MLFPNLPIFLKNATLPHENLDFRGPGRPKTEPRWLPQCFENRAFAPEASGRASGSHFGGPKTLPRGSGERPGSVGRAPGAPQAAQSEPQEAKNELQENQNEPQEGSGGPKRLRVAILVPPDVVFGRFPLDFHRFHARPAQERGNRDALPPQTPGVGREAAEQGRRRSYGLAVSILGRLRA